MSRLKSIVITMTREEAHRAGLLVCGNCGWPKSGHFNFKPHTCAHAECKGYIEVSTVGRLVKQRRKLEKLSKNRRSK